MRFLLIIICVGLLNTNDSMVVSEILTIGWGEFISGRSIYAFVILDDDEDNVSKTGH
jgi:hypothetical protein